MRHTDQEQHARAAIRHIVSGRDQALQITPEKLAEICLLHGLAQDLPPIRAGLEQLWRDRLLRDLGRRTWSIDGRLWRVRCPWGGNFRFEPVPRRRKYK